MTPANSDLELQRLELAEQDAHARFLRLQGIGHPEVVRCAQDLWQGAADALTAYFERKKP